MSTKQAIHFIRELRYIPSTGFRKHVLINNYAATPGKKRASDYVQHPTDQNATLSSATISTTHISSVGVDYGTPDVGDFGLQHYIYDTDLELMAGSKQIVLHSNLASISGPNYTSSLSTSTLTASHNHEQIMIQKHLNLTIPAAPKLYIRDNSASALTIQEGTTPYMVFDSTNSTEKIILKKNVILEADVAAGTGSGSGVFKSNGNHDVVLQTGNSTTGSITITDGANGNISITPNGTGQVVLSENILLGSTLKTVAKWAKVQTTCSGVSPGTHSLSSITFPANAIIMDGFIETITNVTALGSATIGFTMGLTDFAPVRNAEDYTTTSPILAANLSGSGARFKLTSSATIQMTVATSTLESGTINVWVQYIIGDTAS